MSAPAEHHCQIDGQPHMPVAVAEERMQRWMQANVRQKDALSRLVEHHELLHPECRGLLEDLRSVKKPVDTRPVQP